MKTKLPKLKQAKPTKPAKVLVSYPGRPTATSDVTAMLAAMRSEHWGIHPTFQIEEICANAGNPSPKAPDCVAAARSIRDFEKKTGFEWEGGAFEYTIRAWEELASLWDL